MTHLILILATTQSYQFGLSERHLEISHILSSFLLGTGEINNFVARFVNVVG